MLYDLEEFESKLKKKISEKIRFSKKIRLFKFVLSPKEIILCNKNSKNQK